MTLSLPPIGRPSAVALVLLVAAACSEPKPATNIAPTTPTAINAVVGTSVAVAPAVKVTDVDGGGVGGVVVTFAASGGTLGSTSATTAGDGTASAVSWTLGTTAGAQTVTASVDGLTGSPVTFTATAAAGPPASMTKNDGDGQSATINTPVLVKPSVRVFDAHNNPVSNASVTFSVTGGGGTVTGGTVTTTSTGLATVGSWTLGSGIGANTLSAAVFGVASPITFTATGQPVVAQLTVVANGGDKQAAMVSTGVATQPSVLVTTSGSPVAGVGVTFTVLTGGGSITGGTTTTDANGVATVGNWTLGSGMGLNTMTATVAGSSVIGSPLMFSASGCDGVGTGYRITLCLTSDMTPVQKTAFTAAAARWESIVTADLADISFAAGLTTSSCGGRAFAMPAGTIVDDLLIFATIEPIDGASGVLGSASPCQIRSANGLSVVGTMRFDVADVGSMTPANLNSVILHEMGHVLGIGTLWNLTGFFSFLQLPSSAGAPQDTHFNGANGMTAFNSAGGVTYVGNKVPVENTGGSGTINSHWRESVLSNELMTGFINSNVANPLSAITIASLQDLGYSVNLAGADAFSFTPLLLAPGATPGPTIKLHNDMDTYPVYAVDSRGRVMRIIRR